MKGQRSTEVRHDLQAGSGGVSPQVSTRAGRTNEKNPDCSGLLILNQFERRFGKLNTLRSLNIGSAWLFARKKLSDGFRLLRVSRAAGRSPMSTPSCVLALDCARLAKQPLAAGARRKQRFTVSAWCRVWRWTELVRVPMDKRNPEKHGPILFAALSSGTGAQGSRAGFRGRAAYAFAYRERDGYMLYTESDDRRDMFRAGYGPVGPWTAWRRDLWVSHQARLFREYFL